MVGARNVSPLKNIQTGSGTHPAFYLVGTEGLPLGIKQPWHVSDHSPSSSAVVNEWSYISATALCLCGMDRGNVTYFTAQIKLCLSSCTVLMYFIKKYEDLTFNFAHCSTKCRQISTQFSILPTNGQKCV
jgi:hypothetical protein